MKPELFDDRVLILPDASEKITKGGIYIPDSATQFELKKTGIVIAHGEGFVDESTAELFPIKVWIGCRVSFSAHLGEEFSGTDIGLDDSLYLLVNERDIDVILCVRIEPKEFEMLSNTMQDIFFNKIIAQ